MSKAQSLGNQGFVLVFIRESYAYCPILHHSAAQGRLRTCLDYRGMKPWSPRHPSCAGQLILLWTTVIINRRKCPIVWISAVKQVNPLILSHLDNRLDHDQTFVSVAIKH